MSEQITKEKWVPDWREPNQYPNHKDTSLVQWAWEFLRRNPEYQKDYKQALEMPGDEDIDAYKDRTDFAEYFITEPKMKKGETYSELLNRAGSKNLNVSVECIRDDILDIYGLGNPSPGRFSEKLDPSIDEPPEFATDSYPISSPVKWRNIWTRKSLKPDYTDEIVMKFSIESDITDQLEHAKKILEEAKGNIKKSRKSIVTYRDYLRVLDAMDMGMTEQQLMKELNKKKKITYPWSTIKAKRDKARELRDGGYKKLLKIPSYDKYTSYEADVILSKVKNVVKK